MKQSPAADDLLQQILQLGLALLIGVARSGGGEAQRRSTPQGEGNVIPAAAKRTLQLLTASILARM